VERELALGVAREDAVENDQMMVHVKIDARSTALNEVDGGRTAEPRRHRAWRVVQTRYRRRCARWL
jgi:hypothetical protein